MSLQGIVVNEDAFGVQGYEMERNICAIFFENSGNGSTVYIQIILGNARRGELEWAREWLLYLEQYWNT